MLKCFSLIGENDCSYESVGNIFTSECQDLSEHI